MNFLFNEKKGKITVVQKGLKEGLKREQSLKMFFIILIITAYILNKYENDFKTKVTIIGLVLMCFILELINTSIEAVVDRISTSKHFLSGYAKDLASTSTFLFTVFTVILLLHWIKTQWKNYKLYNKDKDKDITIYNFYKQKKNNQKNIFNEWKHVILVIILAVIFLIPLIRYLHNLLKSFSINRHF